MYNDSKDLGWKEIKIETKSLTAVRTRSEGFERCLYEPHWRLWNSPQAVAYLHSQIQHVRREGTKTADSWLRLDPTSFKV